jgi:hypothetical protein
MFNNSNISGEVCPVCGRKLRFKAACCSDPNKYLICQCGFKKVKNEITPMRDSGGSPDPTDV